VLRPWLLVLLVVVGLPACGPASSARTAELVQALERADDVLLRTRPELVAGKYARMATGAFEFYRGNLPVFRHDWEAGRTSRTGFGEALPVPGLGDPHPENFGLLVGGDGVFALEPNDFDSADRVPYLFDLRRLLAGLGLGVRLMAPTAEPEVVAVETARSYATSLVALAGGLAPARVVDAGRSAILQDLFRRGLRDQLARSELDALTTVTDGVRAFRRGGLDPAEPTSVLAEVPAFVRAAVPAALERLGSSPQWAVLDVVREFGSGVASWPRVRLLVLVRGPTDAPGDDEVLELKELAESGVAGWYPPRPVATDTPARVEAALRRAWAVPDADPRWYTTTLLGFPLQVRTESEAHKNQRLSRWTGARASQAELVLLGQALGTLLARVHARADQATLAAVAAQVGRDVDAFAAEQGAFAVTQAQQVLDDHALFQAALSELGPTLGVRVDPTERATSTIQSFLGSAQ
jgi:uncharacterized protein (DUF2252 family)